MVEEVTRWLAERGLDARAGVPLAALEERAANSLIRGLLLQLALDTPVAADPAPETPAWQRFTAYIQEHLLSAPPTLANPINGSAGADLAGTSRIQYPPTLRVIRVMCSGMVHPNLVIDALTKGADAVLVCG